MRADRLLAIMMLLQTRGQMTADALAGELEVTPRTIYRDIDALSVAGVPIYANGGPGGGYALLDSFRTALTGLSEAEVHSLFVLTLPGPLADLSVSQELKSVLLKLTSGVTEDRRSQVDYLRQRLYLDAAGWFQAEEATPHLKRIQEAVWQDWQLQLVYRRRDGTLTERRLSPYGLAAKASIWYLVAAVETEMRVYRVSRIESVRLSATRFTRPRSFELAQFWTGWVAEYEANLPKFPVTLRIAPELAPLLPYMLGDGVRILVEQAEPDADGWRIVDYTFERIEEAEMYVLSMGALADVIAPAALRTRVLKRAKEIVARYEG